MKMKMMMRLMGRGDVDDEDEESESSSDELIYAHPAHSPNIAFPARHSATSDDEPAFPIESKSDTRALLVEEPLRSLISSTRAGSTADDHWAQMPVIRRIDETSASSCRQEDPFAAFSIEPANIVSTDEYSFRSRRRKISSGILYEPNYAIQAGALESRRQYHGAPSPPKVRLTSEDVDRIKTEVINGISKLLQPKRKTILKTKPSTGGPKKAVHFVTTSSSSSASTNQYFSSGTSSSSTTPVSCCPSHLRAVASAPTASAQTPQRKCFPRVLKKVFGRYDENALRGKDERADKRKKQINDRVHQFDKRMEKLLAQNVPSRVDWVWK